MKQLSFGNPLPGGFENWVTAALRDLERASAEDIESVIADFNVTGTFTPTRTLDAANATPADVRNVLATLITDIQRRGQKRSYAT